MIDPHWIFRGQSKFHYNLFLTTFLMPKQLADAVFPHHLNRKFMCIRSIDNHYLPVKLEYCKAITVFQQRNMLLVIGWNGYFMFYSLHALTYKPSDKSHSQVNVPIFWVNFPIFDIALYFFTKPSQMFDFSTLEC